MLAEFDVTDNLDLIRPNFSSTREHVPMKSGLSRMLEVVESFSDGSPVLTAEQLSARNGFAIATCYRYIRDLCDCGLLVKLPNGYAPGPRIIAWDLMIRSNDPLLRNCHDLIERLVEDTGLEFLLSQLFGDRIVNVHYEHNTSNEPLNLGRGSEMPLFKGSSSRVILAAMPTRQLRRIYEAHKNDPDARAIGADWRAFSKALAAVRAKGYSISSGELQRSSNGLPKVGIAAPLFGAQSHILGSLTLIGSENRFGALREDYVSGRLKATAQEISQRLNT